MDIPVDIPVTVPNTNEVHQERLTRTERAALRITDAVGTMRTTYLFVLLACLSLPATLNLVGLLPHGVLPASVTGQSFIWLVTWVCQNFLQLVLLPLLMVGQNLQGRHAELRAQHEYETTVKAEAETAEIKAMLTTLIVRLEDVHDKLNASAN